MKLGKGLILKIKGKEKNREEQRKTEREREAGKRFTPLELVRGRHEREKVTDKKIAKQRQIERESQPQHERKKDRKIVRKTDRQIERQLDSESKQISLCQLKVTFNLAVKYEFGVLERL